MAESKKEGFLFLKSPSGIWKKNWVVVSQSSFLLYHGPEKGEVEKKLRFDPKNFDYKTSSPLASYRKNCFEISAPERIILSAASEQEKTKWLEWLEAVKTGSADSPRSSISLTSSIDQNATDSPVVTRGTFERKVSLLGQEGPKGFREKSFLGDARSIVPESDRSSGSFLPQIDEEKQVKSGSVDQLINCLYTGDFGNHYADIFLISYRSFTTKKILLSTLYIRYLDLQDHPDDESSKAGRLKIINFLKHWIDFNNDFDNDDELINSFFDFCDEISKNHTALAQQLEKKVKSKLEGGLRKGSLGFGHNPPESILPTASNWNLNLDVTFHDLSEVEIARQLCLLQQDLFKKVESWEFFGAAWTKPDKDIKCPNLVNMAQNFNELSRFVSFQILSVPLLKDRAKVLRKWVVIARELRDLGNFNAVFSIISGLASASVYRLKKTFATLTRDKTRVYEELQKMTQPAKSWANYREVLKISNPPSIPYIGVYQTDLVFLEDGSPTFSKNGDVNFQKSRLMAGIIKDIRQFQNLPYNLSPVSSIQQYFQEGFKKAIQKTDDDFWKLSKEIEP